MRWVTAKRLFFLAVLVAFTLSAMRVTEPERAGLTHLESKFRDAIAPVQASFTWLGKQSHHWLSFPVSMYRAGERNLSLEREIEGLKSQVIQLNEYKIENQRLSELLNHKQVMSQSYNFLSASVVGRDPGNWFGTIKLNRGTRDGVRENMIALNHQGLVGRVVSVSDNTSEVLLITDPRSGVGSLVQNTRTPGVVEGAAVVSGMTRMIHIPRDAPLEAGQAVVTSGLGSVFPKGIPVGEITDVRNEPTGLFKSADIRPYVNFYRLEEVLIVTRVLPETVSPQGGG